MEFKKREKTSELVVQNEAHIFCVTINYSIKEFEEYYSSHGIRYEKIVHGTPQHNSIAETMNRTIIEKVRNMLIMAKLPKSL